jgi:hypothetical protein
MNLNALSCGLKFHTMTTWSAAPDASCLSDGAKLTLVTAPLWPRKLRSNVGSLATAAEAEASEGADRAAIVEEAAIRVLRFCVCCCVRLSAACCSLLCVLKGSRPLTPVSPCPPTAGLVPRGLALAVGGAQGREEAQGREAHSGRLNAGRSWIGVVPEHPGRGTTVA